TSGPTWPESSRFSSVPSLSPGFSPASSGSRSFSPPIRPRTGVRPTRTALPPGPRVRARLDDRGARTRGARTPRAALADRRHARLLHHGVDRLASRRAAPLLLGAGLAGAGGRDRAAVRPACGGPGAGEWAQTLAQAARDRTREPARLRSADLDGEADRRPCRGHEGDEFGQRPAR